MNSSITSHRQRVRYSFSPLAGKNKSLRIALAAAILLHGPAGGNAAAADSLPSKTTYSKAYGPTKGTAEVDPAKDLPRYPAVEPGDAVGTWKIKPGFKLQLAAHEPQVRDPVAVSFDERGRMFVVEMIDYSEMRDVTPHLGRVSMLEDKDGDGYYETGTVFADDLPWPTGIICANGGIYVIATPDVYFFKDTKGTGRADVREIVFTGFGSGLKLLNVQGLANCPQWGLDNRIHIQAGGGNRGKVKCLKRPDLPEVELGGRDFWFDPRTYEFGLEAGGAQYGMSFDDYGRKFACSNSDHLQYFLYDDRYAARNPFFSMPNPRQSIAADGGAAEVYRISPDEPWRIVRTRWRVAGVVKGVVEGGGRVSGYFTGATGTTVYRGDAYGADFLNNTFTGDAGGQLVHRKKIYPDGVSLVGKRPDDEQNFEFAASKDTWVRVVNFANAPDGCLHVIDMYREVIEHPWSIPDEIKKHLDLNSGNDRGRIYRIEPERAGWQRRPGVDLGKASTAELVKTLAHPNGWHRDTAARLLYERQDKSAVPLLEKLFGVPGEPLAKIHALGALSGMNALSEGTILRALADSDAFVRERAVFFSKASPRMDAALARLADDPSPRVRFQLALSTQDLAILGQLGAKYHSDKWISAAILSAPPDVLHATFSLMMMRNDAFAKDAAPFVAKLIQIRAASADAAGKSALIDFIAQRGPNPAWLRALGDGLRRAGTTIEKADAGRKLAAVFAKAAATAADANAGDAARLAAIELLALTSPKQSGPALTQCLGAGQADAVQSAAVRTLAQGAGTEITRALLEHWKDYGADAKDAALAALVAREERTVALLEAIRGGAIPATALSASQVQGLLHHKAPAVVAIAKTALASVIPPSREEAVAKYRAALTMKGDAARGREIYAQRCISCHRVGDQGFQLGPDLITVKTKGRDGILTAIIDPNKEVAPQYIAYTVNTKDGQSLMGFVTKDDASGVTLKMIGGGEQTVTRSSIKGTSSSGLSLMPEGLATGLDVQAMADLLTFIEELK